MKKIKTIEAVAAYRTLKALKTSLMSDDAAMRVWKNMKALRHVADIPTTRTWRKRRRA